MGHVRLGRGLGDLCFRLLCSRCWLVGRWSRVASLCWTPISPCPPKPIKLFLDSQNVPNSLYSKQVGPLTSPTYRGGRWSWSCHYEVCILTGLLCLLCRRCAWFHARSVVLFACCRCFQFGAKTGINLWERVSDRPVTTRRWWSELAFPGLSIASSCRSHSTLWTHRAQIPATN